MRREPLELEILEINVGPRLDPEPKPPQPKSSVWGTVVLGFAALVVGFQFFPDESSLGTPVAALPEPAPVTTNLAPATVSASETRAELTWVEVDGLERFESITAPIETDRGYVTVGNPIGLSRGASVVISDDGAQWNRIGTIHGVGGEVNVVGIDRFQGQFLALGTYTEMMPISDDEPRLQLPAVWRSEDGIRWSMTRLHRSNEDIFDPGHLFAGTEAALVGGWTPSNVSVIETYQSLAVELRREVGTGHLRIQTDPLGEVVLTAGPIVVHSERGGGGQRHIMHVRRTFDGANWESVDQDDMGSGLVSLISGTATNGTSTVLLHQNWPAEPPDQLPQLVGSYLLGEDNEALKVFDLRGEPLGSWLIDRGPVEGVFDSTTRSVTISTPEGEDFVFPLDDLAAYGEFAAAPQSALAVSDDGTHWRLTELPTSGLIEVIGPLGPGYLLQSRSQGVEGLWPAVYRYLLLVP